MSTKISISKAYVNLFIEYIDKFYAIQKIDIYHQLKYTSNQGLIFKLDVHNQISNL
jgi:hypothetical protein